MIMHYWPTFSQDAWILAKLFFARPIPSYLHQHKLDWFAHLNSQLEHRICFILPTHRFNHKIVINNYALLTGCEAKMAGYLRLYWPFLPLQGCALRKIEGSPALWTCEIQCAQQMISMKKQRFSSRLRTKVTDVGATGHRAQPGLGQ